MKEAAGPFVSNVPQSHEEGRDLCKQSRSIERILCRKFQRVGQVSDVVTRIEVSLIQSKRNEKGSNANHSLVRFSFSMGQGAPETGPLPGAPSRNFSMTILDAELEYAPVTGLPELRHKVAAYYNRLYRQGKDSQYTEDNVCIVPGGRAGITRIMAVLGTCQVGFFTPDYTSYEQALGFFLRVSPSPLLHRDVNEATMSAEDFEFECRGRGLGAVLLSNPANPTGQSIEGDRLQEYVEISRSTKTSLMCVTFTN